MALNRPFSGLGRRWRQRPAAEPPTPSASRPTGPSNPEPDSSTEADLFAQAMDGVDPLSPDARDRVSDAPGGRREPRPLSDDDAETLAHLTDLVNGAARFDVSDTTEFVSGHVAGLDPRVSRRLRRGEFAWQDHLDLHTLTVADAREVVGRFITRAVRTGHRCVLIVHGRGQHSKDNVPVLKQQLVSWLSRGTLGRCVLAFASARPHDGGAGAMYVLLRRDRRKRPIDVSRGPVT